MYVTCSFRSRRGIPICPILIVEAIVIVNTHSTPVENWGLTRTTVPIGYTYPVSSESAKSTDLTLVFIGASQQLASVKSCLLKIENVYFAIIAPMAKDATSLTRVSNQNTMKGCLTEAHFMTSNTSCEGDFFLP
jgi:hypothetical protein